MKRPSEEDFEVKASDVGVEVIFKPTTSRYSYNRLADAKDIAQHGPVSPAYSHHAGPTGDTGEYAEHEVREIADRLATEAAQR